ncbi:DUF551 domain-containing protein [Salmonella enterica subsp. enterica serovar Litchfield]|nr:DUF551 domain-containing protein [Salmonella enterica subsp. enterica serovar Litchfield]MBJ5403663.1 DUF551 domain-containing protein [Salmonella enterica subsp. enterica serovar Litchfield]
MTTNHPAHGPVSLDRLHQIREILSKAAAQSDGGNLGYAMADAVKVIDGAIATARMVPYGYVHKDIYESCGTAGLSNDHEAYRNSNTHIALYTAPPAPLVDWVPLGDSPYDVPYSMPSNLRELIAEEIGILFSVDDAQSVWNVCRSAAMLQAGNSPVTPDGWIPVSERMPESGRILALYGRREKEECEHYVDEGYLGSNGAFYFFCCEGGLRIDDCHPDDKAKVTHWMYRDIPAAPQQEVERG